MYIYEILFVWFQEADEVVDQVAGHIEPLPLEFVKEFYEMTGVDLSGLKAKIQQCMVQCHEVLVLKCIAFSKDLKQFMELPLTDRILLIKGR